MKKLNKEQELLEREIYKILPSFKSQFINFEEISNLLNSDEILIDIKI